MLYLRKWLLWRNNTFKGRRINKRKIILVKNKLTHLTNFLKKCLTKGVTQYIICSCGERNYANNYAIIYF